MKQFSIFLLCCVVFVGGCSGSSDDETVVVYVSADDYVARQVIAAFESETGIKVKMKGDIEAQKTTGLVNQLRLEKDHPQADVFWSSEIFQTITLAEEGVLAPFTSPLVSDWPEQYRDSEGRWYAFAARARVIVYAPDRIVPDEVPRLWIDLCSQRFDGRIVMADPRFGTTGGHLGAFKVHSDRLSPRIYQDIFLQRLAANHIRMLPGGNAAVVEAVANGEADLGMTDTDDVWAAQVQGLSVAMIYPRHDLLEDEYPGNGTLLIPNTVAMVQGSQHPIAAARFIEFMLSEKVERILAESDSRNIPLRPGLADLYPELAVPDPLLVDYVAAAAARNDAVNLAWEILSASESNFTDVKADAP